MGLTTLTIDAVSSRVSRGQNLDRHAQMQGRFRIKNETSFFPAPQVRLRGEAGKVEVSRLAGSSWGWLDQEASRPGASFFVRQGCRRANRRLGIFLHAELRPPSIRER